MNNVLIKTTNVKFSNIIEYQDIEIQKGIVTFITGESGCGKSTLLRLFNNIISPSCGEILYIGKNINEINTIELRKNILLISQDVFLFDASIGENFKKFYEYRGQTPLNKDKIIEFLKLCCLDLPLEKDTVTMSGGERQRLYMAIFLSFAQESILIDEPTSALDAQTGDELVCNIINHCKANNLNIVIVSHDSNITERFAEAKIIITKRKS